MDDFAPDTRRTVQVIRICHRSSTALAIGVVAISVVIGALGLVPPSRLLLFNLPMLTLAYGVWLTAAVWPRVGGWLLCTAQVFAIWGGGMLLPDAALIGVLAMPLVGLTAWILLDMRAMLFFAAVSVGSILLAPWIFDPPSELYPGVTVLVLNLVVLHASLLTAWAEGDRREAWAKVQAQLDLLADVHSGVEAARVGSVRQGARETLLAESHDLRAPVLGMLGVAEVLSERTTSGSTFELLGVLRRSASELLDGLDMFLAVERAKEQGASWESFRLIELALDLEDRFGSRLNTAAEVDEAQIRLKGSDIFRKGLFKLVEAGLSSEASSVELRVERGVQLTKLELLSDESWNVDSTGLARAALESAGCQVAVSGSRASVTAATSGVLRDTHVLVVDDDRLSRLVASRRLGGPMITVADVATSAEAAAHALALPPDVVVIDRQLASGSGFELADRLREQLGDRTVLCVLSAHALSELRREAQAHRVDLVFSKPLTSDDVAQLWALVRERAAVFA